MSDENEDLIQKTFVESLGAKYPFVRASGADGKYGISFFPSVYCIDADGVVFSVPTDRMPSEATIEELLQAVPPPLPDEARYAPLKAMWAKHEYPKLRDFLTKALAEPKLDEVMRGVFEAQQKALDERSAHQVARVETLGQGPDYATAQAALATIEKNWKGLPPADAAKQQLARFASDETIKKELAAGKALQKLLDGYDTTKLAQVRKLVGELKKFAEKYVGTEAGRQAAQRREELLGH